MLELEVKSRDKKGNLADLRKKGFMPAVYYGKKQESTPISIAFNEFLKVWKKAGESSVVTLKNGTETLDSLIHEIDFDPVTGNPRHADFYVFERDHKLEVSVPIEFISIAPGVKDLGGVFVKVLFELKIEAMPKDLPQKIEVDISSLTQIGSQILARDIVLPKGVDLKENPEEVVALVAEPKKEEEAEAAPIDLSSIEVEKKGKEAKEGEGEAEVAEEAK